MWRSNRCAREFVVGEVWSVDLIVNSFKMDCREYQFLKLSLSYCLLRMMCTTRSIYFRHPFSIYAVRTVEMYLAMYDTGSVTYWILSASSLGYESSPVVYKLYLSTEFPKVLRCIPKFSSIWAHYVSIRNLPIWIFTDTWIHFHTQKMLWRSWNTSLLQSILQNYYKLMRYDNFL